MTLHDNIWRRLATDLYPDHYLSVEVQESLNRNLDSELYGKLYSPLEALLSIDLNIRLAVDFKNEYN